MLLVFKNWSKEKGFNSWELGITILITITVFLWGLVSYFLDDDLGVNGLGDFFAGIFTPIAFYWLIRGYMLQKQELQQNTKALELQAEELKNTVAEYKHMVEINKKQLELYQKQIITPKLKTSLKLFFNGNNPIIDAIKISMKMENLGGDAINICLVLGRERFHIDVLLSHQNCSQVISINELSIKQLIDNNEAYIHYTDDNGQKHQMTQIVEIEDMARHIILSNN